jgi:hypothetical protein
MLKNILKLKGVQKLDKNEQKSINGGLPCGCPGTHPFGTYRTTGCPTCAVFE